MDHCSRISTLHLVPDWLKKLLEESHEEAKQQRKYPVRLITGTSRAVMWSLCSHLGCKSYSLPGQACRLLERYLSIRIHSVLASLDPEEWETYKDNMSTRMPLLMTVCYALAAKMNCASAKAQSGVLRARLLAMDICATVDEINAAEFEVYSTLGFRIPLWTCVEVAQLLAMEVAIPSEKLEMVAATVDLAEFKRDFIEEKVSQIVNLSPVANKTSCVRALHLSAGAVVAVGRILHLPGPDPSTRLSDLTRAPLPYINCIADLICTIVIEKDDSPPTRTSSRKTAF